MENYRIPAQRDLFTTMETATGSLPPEVTRLLLPLLERLLAEALATDTKMAEGCDDQDQP